MGYKPASQQWATVLGKPSFQFRRDVGDFESPCNITCLTVGKSSNNTVGREIMIIRLTMGELLLVIVSWTWGVPISGYLEPEAGINPYFQKKSGHLSPVFFWKYGFVSIAAGSDFWSPVFFLESAISNKQVRAALLCYKWHTLWVRCLVSWWGVLLLQQACLNSEQPLSAYPAFNFGEMLETSSHHVT